jgi:hypothetical protein
MTNFDLEDAVTRFQQVLESSGIEAELDRLGVEDGDTVTIAGYDMTWGDPDFNEQYFEPRPRRSSRADRE